MFGPRMLDARIRQVTIGDYLHSRPCKPMLLSPSPDGVEPTIDQMVPERCDRRRAHRHGVVGQPATKHLGKPFCPCASILPSWRVALSCSLICLSFARIRLRAGVLPQHEAAAASSGRAIVREPKGSRTSPACARTSGAAGRNCLPAELDETSSFSGWRPSPKSAMRAERSSRNLSASSWRSKPTIVSSTHSARQSYRPSIDVAAIDEPRDRRRSAGRHSRVAAK